MSQLTEILLISKLARFETFELTLSKDIQVAETKAVGYPKAPHVRLITMKLPDIL